MFLFNISFLEEILSVYIKYFYLSLCDSVKRQQVDSCSGKNTAKTQ